MSSKEGRRDEFIDGQHLMGSIINTGPGEGGQTHGIVMKDVEGRKNIKGGKYSNLE